jgi:hypothetical protein
MKTTIKIGLILSGLLIIVSITNCSRYELLHKYLITNTELQNLEVTIDKDSNLIVDENQDDEISAKNYFGIRIIFQDSITETIDLLANNFSIISKAHASQPSFESYQLINSIESLTINTINKFDSLHNENTDITEYFYIYQNDRSPLYKLNTQLDFYLDNNCCWEMLSKIDLILLQNSTVDSFLQFEINITYSDSSVTNLTTSKIKQE